MTDSIKEIRLPGNLYNMLHGENTYADILLKALGITKEECGRYRDCFTKDGEIVLHTRLGGDNRAHYRKEILCLKSNIHYLSNSDSGYDSTYANFYFAIPLAIQGLIGNEIQEAEFTPTQKFQETMRKLEAARQKTKEQTT